MDGHDGAGATRELDALRRRLYAPGAGDDDLTRYRSALSRMPPPPPPLPEPVPRRPWRQRIAGPAVIVAAGLAAVAVLPLLPARDAVSAVPTPSLAPALPIPADVRNGFVQALDRTASPDLADYLLAHPAARPAELSSAVRGTVEEHYGLGSGTIGLSPDAAAADGGRMTVIVLTDRGDELRWEASRTAVRTDHRQYRQVVADRELHLAAGAPVSTTIRYDHGVPRALTVVVTQEVRWDVVIAFTD